ncbi:uncharacterized protein BDV14DRAFT_8492 [Aspergillus stella-maris]|uniref:uncharacterized protein n=1 Tax=Aspergillus stella-maris TaxID=1810926 RepID=UPI003CCD0DA8
MGQSPSTERTAIADNTTRKAAMVILGRDKQTVSFPSSPTPVRRKRKTMSAMMSAPEHQDNVEIAESTSDGKVNANLDVNFPTEPANFSDPTAAPAEDNSANPPSSAPSTGDLYAPLLAYICAHTFMRDKKYPVPRSSRIQFVRDVNEEGKRLGYEQAVIHRVILDIKRYYLVNVGWGCDFTERAEFGLEFDDALTKPGSEAAGVSKDKGSSTGKVSEGLPLGTDFLKKRQSVETTGSKASRNPVYRYGLDPFDLNDIIDDGLSSYPGPETSTDSGSKKKTVIKDKQLGGLSLNTQPSSKRMSAGTAGFKASRTPVYRYGLDPFDLNDIIDDGLSSYPGPEMSTNQKNKTMGKGKQVERFSLNTQSSSKRMSGGTASLSSSAALESNDYLDRFDLRDFLRDDVDIVDKALSSKPQQLQGKNQKNQKKRKRSGSSESAPSKAASESQKKANKEPKSNAAPAKKKKSTVSVKVEGQRSLQESSRSGAKKKRQRAKSAQPSQQAVSKTKSSAKNAKHGAAVEDPIVLDF